MPNSNAEPAGPTRQLRVPNEMPAFEAARQAALDFIAGHGLPEKSVYQLELVLEETLMNRLWHAYPPGGSHVTDLTLRLDPDALVLCFEDDGVPFDPLQAPLPVPPTSIEAARPGGLGLMLTRKAASGCDYERIDGRNRFTVRLARG